MGDVNHLTATEKYCYFLQFDFQQKSPGGVFLLQSELNVTFLPMCSGVSVTSRLPGLEPPGSSSQLHMAGPWALHPPVPSGLGP